MQRNYLASQQVQGFGDSSVSKDSHTLFTWFNNVNYVTLELTEIKWCNYQRTISLIRKYLYCYNLFYYTDIKPLFLV